MSEMIKLFGDVEISGALILPDDNAEFPVNPGLGTFVIKDRCLYGYLRIGNMETWYPFANKTQSYIHNQYIPLVTWTVNHGLGTDEVWFMVKNTDGQIVNVGKTSIDSNSFNLNFTVAMSGLCVVVAPTSLNVPQIKASEIYIGSGNEVYINNSGVYINGVRVLTDAFISSEIASAVAPKADTSYVDAMLATKANITYVDSALASFDGGYF